ncbi:MAG: PD-(D/E)XK nuclease family protein [Spirochaetes bacterium]|uniref:PD-(D/E)XK nuclease family protein n=1 Tax=Candidatus Ornithospirochaeta stercoripullorum TaxID=2840899 RepID=A0A9D9DZM6_9SPIO|nr:PD-(D/E)XK nuclease family protein [Candidatus Ornithospirochaeta stercoripullorum]
MTQIDDLFDLIERGRVLVFPTEESARAFSCEYVRRRKKGLLASSVIAFDNFASLFMEGKGERKPVSEAERLIFSSYLAKELSDNLRYFSSPEHPEMKERLAAFFRPLLPYLDDALLLEKKDANASYDINIIRKEYSKFLANLNVFESSLEPVVIPEHFDGQYVIVMPEAFPKESRIVEKIKSMPNILIIDDLRAEIPSLSLYQNEKSELRALMIHIRELSDKCVTLDQIAITTSNLERIRPYLEEEGYLFGIPLDFREGNSPLNTAAGAFLSSLSDIFTSHYSIDELKSFMLDSAIPFKEPDVLRRFIQASVDFAITSAPDIHEDRYLKLPKDCGTEYYRVLRFTLDKLMSETVPERILSYLHTLMSGLLKEEEFRGAEEDAAVYSFAMDNLSAFLSSATDARKQGYLNAQPLFPLFIDYLKKLRYVPQKRVEGVAVYPFTQDSAIPYPYRFVIGLNGKESTAVVKKASFLFDYELAETRTEDDITEDILSLYAAMTEHLELSAASETYQGFALPVTALLDKTVSASVPERDAVGKECVEETGQILPLQKRSYESALLTSLRKRRRHDDMTYWKQGMKRSLPIKLSYTSFNAWRKCPYLYALQYVFQLRNLPSYESPDMDHLEIGSRLHSILEKFYLQGGGDARTQLSRLFENEMNDWKNGIRRGKDGVAYDMPSSASRPKEFLVSYLRSRYLPKLISVVENMNEMSRMLDDGKGLEEPLEASFPNLGFVLEGRADRIAETADGSGYLLYDYKKGRKFQSEAKREKSYQFHIYRLLIEASDEYTKPVLGAYFVSLLDGKIDNASQSPERDELLENLSAAGNGIGAGDWHATPSDDTCKGCAYRGVCRRRFSIK